MSSCSGFDFGLTSPVMIRTRFSCFDFNLKTRRKLKLKRRPVVHCTSGDHFIRYGELSMISSNDVC